MKQLGLLFAAFGGTLAVLLLAFLVVRQLAASGGTTADAGPSPSATADASPSPSASAVAVASRTPAPSIAPVASPSASARTFAQPSVSASPTPARPTATPRPTPTPAPSVAPGGTIQVVIPGSKYLDPIVASNGTIMKLAGGGVVLSSDRTFSDRTEVSYKLSSGDVPAGVRIARMDVAVCGVGDGDFWETYGPSDADPAEYEGTNPDGDGCWHFLGGSGKDSTVHAIILNGSTLRIDKVIYVITTG